MEKRRWERLKERALIVKAIAHPTRLLILEELALGERCVSELGRIAAIGLPALSEHLRRLKDAGIVYDRKEIKHVFYGLRVRVLLGVRECIESVLAAKTRRLKTLCRTERAAVSCEHRRHTKS